MQSVSLATTNNSIPSPTISADTVPIIFIHKGYSRYLEYVVRQARITNPTNPIYLFGDSRNKHLPGVTHIDIQPVEERAYPFEKIYKHYSYKDYTFEMYCLKRYYVFKQIMDEYGLQKAFLCDSDVMIYCNLDQEMKRLNLSNYDVAFHVHPAEWLREVVAHFSFWTYTGIDQFCNFLTQMYTERVQELEDAFHKKLELTRHNFICDNSLLYDFLVEYKERLPILDLTPVHQSTALDLVVFDEFMGENYKMIDTPWMKCKKIYKKEDGYYCYNTKSKQMVKFNILHFCYKTKGMLHKYYQGNDLGMMQLKDECTYYVEFARKTVRLRTRLQKMLKPGS